MVMLQNSSFLLLIVYNTVQVLVESGDRAVEYGSVVLKAGEHIRQDMALDSTEQHLYAMTDNTVCTSKYAALYLSLDGKTPK